MYIGEMIRQSNEIFCFTIRNLAITAHAFSHVNSSRSGQKIKQFQRILTFYAKVEKDTTQDKKATTQDKKDFWGPKGTKRGHSGQKGRRGTFLALCFSLSFIYISRRLACFVTIHTYIHTLLGFPKKAFQNLLQYKKIKYSNMWNNIIWMIIKYNLRELRYLFICKDY